MKQKVEQWLPVMEESYYVMGMEFVWHDKKVLEIVTGDGSTL